MRAMTSVLLRLVGTIVFSVGVIFAAGVATGRGRPMCRQGAADLTHCDIWVRWLWDLGVRDLRILAPNLMLCIGVACVGLLMLAIGGSLTVQKLSASTSHGSARYASTAELRRFGYSEAACAWWIRLQVAMKLRSGYPHVNGVVLGQEDTAKLSMYLGPRGGPAFTVVKPAPLIIVREHHVAVEGPPGSGKDVSIAIPSLWYDYGRSVVVLDPKGDQHEATSGTRSAFSIVKKFAPTEPNSDHFNPLCVVPVGTPGEVTEAEQIANALLGVMKDEKDPSTFYSKSAQPLLTAAIVYALNHPKRGNGCSARGCNCPGFSPSLPGAFDILGSGGNQKDTIARISSGLPKSAEYLRKMLETMLEDKKVIPSMFTTCMNALDFCRYPAVRDALSGSDFVPSDLFSRDVPYSLYLVVPFKYADALRPLMRLMLNVLVSSHVAKRKFDTCYYLNEFPSIGAVPAIPRAAAEIRAYGVQFVLFWQSEGQVFATYGKDAGQTILDTCRARVLLGVSGRLAAENATALFGKTTIVKARETEAVSTKSFLERTNTKTRGEGEQARELMTPDEVRTLTPEKAMIFLPYVHPYLATRCVHYSQPRFKKALAIPPVKPYRAQPKESVHVC
jgi:type IV secretion system protein VirD4